MNIPNNCITSICWKETLLSSPQRNTACMVKKSLPGAVFEFVARHTAHTATHTLARCVGFGGIVQLVCVTLA